MPVSNEELAVLQKIADIAKSDNQINEIINRIIDEIRLVINAKSLIIVLNSASKGAINTWASSSSKACADEQRAHAVNIALSKSDEPIDGVCVEKIMLPDNQPAFIVIFDAAHEFIESDFYKMATSYLYMLLQNVSLNNSLTFSGKMVSKRFEEIAAIYEISKATEVTEMHPLLDMIVKKASTVMDAQACSLLLKDTKDGSLIIKASFGLTDEVVSGTRISVGEGIAGQVAETGEPMLITDISSDPRFSDAIRPRPGISGSMCVPLKDEDGVCNGVLSMRRHSPRSPFNSDDLKLFSVFATHAALAIANARLYNRLHRKVQEMATIADVLRAINSTLDINQVLDQIADNITRVVGFDRCCVYLLDTKNNEFVAGAQKGYVNNSMCYRIKQDDGVLGIAAKERTPIFSRGVSAHPDGTEEEGEFLAAPIVVRNICIGAVVVDNFSSKQIIETQNVELLATFVTQAGIAIENARLYEAMEEKYSELNVLYEHSTNISSAYGFDNAAEMLVNAACAAIKCDGAGLLTFDSRREVLQLSASTGKVSRHTKQIQKIIKKKKFIDFIRSQRVSVIETQGVINKNTEILRDNFKNLMPVLLSVPLVSEDTTIGVLLVCKDIVEEFSPAELKMISIITTHAATVLKNAINYEQKMRQRVLELTALYDFSKKISSAANMEQALESILAILSELVDYDESFIYAIDQERKTAVVKASSFKGEPTSIPPDENLDGISVTSWAVNERKALLSPDITRDSRLSGFMINRGHIRSLMSIPLIVQDEVVGVLSVHSNSPNQYSEDDVRILSIISSQGAAIYRELTALTALTSYTDNILSSIAAGVVTIDSDGIVLTWNAAAEEISKVSESEIIGLNHKDALQLLAISDEEKNNISSAIKEVLKTGETYQGFKLHFHPIAGEDLYLNLSVSKLMNRSSEELGLVIIFEDITKDIKMENEIRRMSELAAIGQLAASIAHELRNPLSSIKGAAQFLQNEFSDNDAINEFLGIIIDEVNGLNKLTTEFLDFARPIQMELQSTSINEVVNKTLNLMKTVISENQVKVKKKLDKNAPIIRADSGQLNQVLKNIFLNALQAMPDGGTLTIETTSTPTKGVCLTISDTGIGMPPERMNKIFQPFFTTKTKGTGLGLSVVKKIIENHGGKIEFESIVGKGTTFKFILPHTGISQIASKEADNTMERRMSGELRKGG